MSREKKFLEVKIVVLEEEKIMHAVCAVYAER